MIISLPMLKIWPALRVLFVQMNGHGEALPERWVADACHSRGLISKCGRNREMCWCDEGSPRNQARGRLSTPAERLWWW
jgi:hypothetical protein